MTRVGWLADDPGYVGGAELTEKAFAEAAPAGVEIVRLAPGETADDLDVAVCHNIVTYQPEWGINDQLPHFDVPVWRYHHDVGPALLPETWEWLSNFQTICVSPLQREKMGLHDAHLVPPAINLEPFREASRNAGERKGAVAVGPWMSPTKAPDAAAEWAAGNGGISFIGAGLCAPPGSIPVDHKDMPETLARFKTYVHLPRALEPCGRSTIEAWAAGLEVVTNRLEGARHWISEEPEKLDSAAQDFWNLILGER